MSNKYEKKRFFSDASFWNKELPANPEIDKKSAEWIKMLEKEPSGENFGINLNNWTIPVYEVNAETPIIKVKHHILTEQEKDMWMSREHYRYGHSKEFDKGVPIPANAVPDPKSDKHIALIDWEKMVGWDMWGMKRLSDGSVESKTGMKINLKGDGVFSTEELGVKDGESVHFYGPSRASGVPAFAGLIMYDEVISGEINHKLAGATRFAAYKEFVYPAAWTDGPVIGGIPEGAVIQLDPDIDLSKFDMLPGELVVARAMQKYGMVIVDWSGGQCVYAEGLYGHSDKSWDGILRDWTGGINSIPYKYYRVLKAENIIKRGDEHLKIELGY